MPSNGTVKGTIKSNYNNKTVNNTYTGVTWGDCNGGIEPPTENFTILPSTNINDDQVIKFHDFLGNLVKHEISCNELDVKDSDTIETLYKKLNYRIAQCKKYKESALNITENLINNYVIISKYEGNYTDCDEVEYEDEPTPNLNHEINKSITFPEQICFGYIYRIVLDIRKESFFHVYFKSIIYTDTLGRSANLREDEIRHVSFEEISTAYKIITKEEYERKIKELFIKDISTN